MKEGWLGYGGWEREGRKGKGGRGSGEGERGRSVWRAGD